MYPREISSTNFYGKRRVNRSDDECRSSPVRPNVGVERYVPRSHLLGPTLTKKVFHKQSDALEFARQRGGGLMCFAFQPGITESAARLFLVAHPEVFWHYDEQRPLEDRCSFEVIPESTVCKLYLDLEYDTSLNPERHGSRMVNVLKRIIMRYLFSLFNVSCEDNEIIDLDSSTGSKFSRHLIFNLDSACFVDNYHVGNFVKRIFQDIHDRLSLGASCNELSSFSTDELSSLYVLNSKQIEIFFCDLGVYTKNRHFRMYRSTKRGKNAPLVLHSKPRMPNTELEIFLSSLVTYVKDHLRLLHVPPFQDRQSSKQKTTPLSPANSIHADSASSNPFPVVGKFISSLVQPGRIYRSGYFSSSNTLIFDIVGYRYCGNIGRQHKSNNIKYIVHLNDGLYYQKCHDPDCAQYKSVGKHLPAEIAFEVCSNEVDGFPEEIMDICQLIEDAYNSSGSFLDECDFTQ